MTNFNNNKNFYPTSNALIEKMINGIDFSKVQTILEPSAGKGNIVEYIQANKTRYNQKLDIDCIESDLELQAVLKDKGMRLIFDDFIRFQTFKRYDLIIMNPPFENGDKHLMKALELSSSIVCILNAETLKNPYSNSRKLLAKKLEELNADIEYESNAFLDGERQTNCEIAIIKITSTSDEYESKILKDLNLEKSKTIKEVHENQQNNVMHHDFIIQLVERFNYETKAGINLINEYQKLLPYLKDGIESDEYKYVRPILQLKMSSNDKDLSDNSFLEEMRLKYWRVLFNNPKFIGRMSSNLRTEYFSKIDSLRDYDFNVYNIKEIIKDIEKHLNRGIAEQILKLFDDLSYKYSYMDNGKNTYMYDGWKTNKAHKINKKIILPLNAFCKYSDKIDLNWDVKNRLEDLQKIFDFLDMNRTENVCIKETLELSQKLQIHTKIKLKYFYVTFYKKGTAHLEFTNDELLKKFNIFGSQRKGWLPPTFGNKYYSEMSSSEQSIIDAFEGKDSYNETMDNTDYFITKFDKVQLI